MASFNKPRLINGLKAGADLSSSLHKAVKYDASGDVVLAGAGEAAIGFLMNEPKSGEAAEVAGPGGGALAKAAAAIVHGDYLKSDANGDMVVAVATDQAVAVARDAAASGDKFEVEPMFYKV